MPVDAVIDRLVAATNAHDLDALVACFADDYRLEMPLHPARDFVGPAQVRRNWEQIFAAVPDIEVTVSRQVVDGDTVWTEWEMRGTRPDRSLHLMRGVIIFGTDGSVIRWGRFYLDPVDEGTSTVDEALRAQVVR